MSDCDYDSPTVYDSESVRVDNYFLLLSTVYTMCTKNVRQVSFYILKQLEPMFIIFGPQYLDYAYKRMRNFPPRLSYVATLPEKTL